MIKIISKLYVFFQLIRQFHSILIIPLKFQPIFTIFLNASQNTNFIHQFHHFHQQLFSRLTLFQLQSEKNEQKSSQSVSLIQKDKQNYSQYNNFPKKMRNTQTKSKKYAKISQKRRNDLINLVTEKNYSIPKAALVLKISPSTAKNIIKIYKQLGKIMNKKMSKGQKTKMLENVSSGQQWVQKLSENQQQKIKIQKQHEETNYDLNNLGLFYNFFYVIPVYPMSVEMFPSGNLSLL